MLSAAVLAGGHASRLGGRDKSGLLVGGRSVLERQLEQLRLLSDDLMVVGRPGSPASPAVRVIDDRIPECGPLGGLEAALAAARHDVVIILACDMPYVTTALLKYLAALMERAEAVVPRTDRAHPLCAAYHRTCHAAVERMLVDGRLAMRALLDQLTVREVTREELLAFGTPERLLTNVNTIADYDALPLHDR